MPRARSVLLAALVAIVPVAGCLGAGTGSQDGEGGAGNSGAFVDPMGHDHDHSDPALHDFSMNFELLSHHPLVGSESKSAGAHALDARAGWLFVALYGDTVDVSGGVFILNLSDPAKPEPVGHFRVPGALGGDRSMEATVDAEFVVLGTEAVTCAGHVNPFAPGLFLVDVRDKANPVVVDYVPNSGVHSVTIHRIDGEDYVFAATSPGGIYHVDKSLPKPRLVPLAEFAIGHDSVAVDDPLLGKPLLYVADGMGPMNVFDVSDPARPQLVAKWNIPNRGDDYYVHTVAAEVTPDGRRIVVVTSEDWEDYASPLWVLDATRFDLVETLATWTNPGGHPADGLRYSLHNPRLVDGTLYLAHYHGGVWALDLTTPESPTVKGYHLPHEAGGARKESATQPVSTALCGAFNLADAPLTFDVEYYEGVLYAADLHTGLYALAPP